MFLSLSHFFIQICMNTLGEVSVGSKSNATSTAFERPRKPISVATAWSLCTTSACYVAKHYWHVRDTFLLFAKLIVNWDPEQHCTVPRRKFQWEIISPAVMMPQFISCVLYCWVLLEGKWFSRLQTLKTFSTTEEYKNSWWSLWYRYIDVCFTVPLFVLFSRDHGLKWIFPLTMSSKNTLCNHHTMNWHGVFNRLSFSSFDDSSGGDEKQRRLVRRLLLASIRNCLWNSSHIQKVHRQKMFTLVSPRGVFFLARQRCRQFFLRKPTSLCLFEKKTTKMGILKPQVSCWKWCLASCQDLHDDDMLSIIHLVSCIEEADLPFFMAIILYISCWDMTRGWNEGWQEPTKSRGSNQHQ